MSKSLIVGLALGATLVSALSCSNGAMADPSSSEQSAWRRSALQSDASLKDPLVRRGKEVFEARCQICHGAYPKEKSGEMGTFTLPLMPGTYALELKYKGQKPALLEERTDLTPDLVALFVRRGGGGFMPAFRPTEVSNEDLKALGAYLARKR
jgi:mono/diheme cytochrome c family protein